MASHNRYGNLEQRAEKSILELDNKIISDKEAKDRRERRKTNADNKSTQSMSRKEERKKKLIDIKKRHRGPSKKDTRKSTINSIRNKYDRSDFYSKIRDSVTASLSLEQNKKDLLTRKQDGTLFQKGVPGYKPENMGNIGNLSKKERTTLYNAHKEEAAKSLKLGQNTNPFKNDDVSMQQQNYSNKAIKKMDSKLLRLSEEIIDPKTPNDQIVKKQSIYDNIKKIRSDVNSVINPESNRTFSTDAKKTYRPGEGINGYGLGLNRFLEASDSALIGRGIGFLTFAGAGESLMNSFGILTSTQNAMVKKETSMFKRVFNNASMIRMGTIGSMLYSANIDQGLGGFVSDNLTYAAGLQGWRIGTSFSPLAKKAANAVGNVAATPWRIATAADNFITGKPNNTKFWNPASTSKASRAAWGIAGGITGAAIGALAVTGIEAAISDITSNQSTIRKVAKNISTRTIYASTATNGATSSSRQAALNKLARSGLNDRALLYGNEARILGGII